MSEILIGDTYKNIIMKAVNTINNSSPENVKSVIKNEISHFTPNSYIENIINEVILLISNNKVKNPNILQNLLDEIMSYDDNNDDVFLDAYNNKELIDDLYLSDVMVTIGTYIQTLSDTDWDGEDDYELYFYMNGNEIIERTFDEKQKYIVRIFNWIKLQLYDEIKLNLMDWILNDQSILSTDIIVENNSSPKIKSEQIRLYLDNVFDQTINEMIDTNVIKFHFDNTENTGDFTDVKNLNFVEKMAYINDSLQTSKHISRLTDFFFGVKSSYHIASQFSDINNLPDIEIKSVVDDFIYGEGDINLDKLKDDQDFLPSLISNIAENIIYKNSTISEINNHWQNYTNTYFDDTQLIQLISIIKDMYLTETSNNEYLDVLNNIDQTEVNNLTDMQLINNRVHSLFILLNYMYDKYKTTYASLRAERENSIPYNDSGSDG